MADAAARSRTGARSYRRGGYAFLVLLLVSSAALLAFFLYGRVTVRNWDVEAPAGVDAEAVRRGLVEKYSGISFFSLDLKKIREDLASMPLVGGVKAVKRFPDSVTVSLAGRKAVLAVICEMGGRSRAALVDGEGVVFRIDDESANADLPVLSGLRFENPSPGMKLPEAFLPLVSSVAALEESGSALIGFVSEIRYVKRAGGEGECVIYPIGSAVPVRSSARITEDTLKSAALVLDVMKKRGLEPFVREVDLRTGAIVYKTKEGGV